MANTLSPGAGSGKPKGVDAQARIAVALLATEQMEGLFNALIAQAIEVDKGDDDIQVAAVIRALAIRGKRLNSAAMSALGDHSATVKSCQRIIDDGDELPVKDLPINDEDDGSEVAHG
jgi:hypothetical protein